MKLITLLVVIAGVIALAQLAKVGQLTSLIRNKREEEISAADTRLNGGLFVAFMVAFYASFIWLIIRYGDYNPPAASAHGETYDTLMNFNMYIIMAVFFLVNTVLFLFANKYRQEAGRKAKFFAHDNRLELIWTVIPSIVLAVIIIYGLRTWNEMTGEASEDALRVELYSKQFDWTARYPGADGEFGLANYNLITPTNPLGIVTADGVSGALEEIEGQIAALESELAHERGTLLAQIEEVEAELHASHDHGHGHGHGDHGHGDHADHGDHDDHGNHHGMSAERKAMLEARLHELEHMLESSDVVVLSNAAAEAKADMVHRLKRHRQRIMEVKPFDYEGGVAAWEAGADDKIMKGEFHLPVGREVEFVFRSRDVIHSAYMPHFRAQMNTVPGVPTRFKMTPTITTDSMRTVLDDPDFDYVLLCNKVCGAAHFNMQMKVVVESEESYNAWLESQEEFLADKEVATESDARAEAANIENNESATL
ncbi:MAG: cytochrome c oxidase subunit II transmembrane domain-containing protein [Bacteroidota bacterium]|nr:cytochrome c oxidase subunit II transmembrane domain-containing protein [Bacteroidota bacterium]